MNPLRTELSRYASFSDEEWARIESRFRKKNIKKNDHLLVSGDVCTKLGFVLDGFLRTFTVNADGKEVTTHFSYDRSFVVSFYSFKNQAPSFEYIQAIEDTALMEISYHAVRELFDSSLTWRMAYNAIVEDAYACMEKRNYVLQNLSAAEKYNYFMQHENQAIIRKAHLQHISSYLGMKQETLSRIRKKTA